MTVGSDLEDFGVESEGACLDALVGEVGESDTGSGDGIAGSDPAGDERPDHLAELIHYSGWTDRVRHGSNHAEGELVGRRDGVDTVDPVALYLSTLKSAQSRSTMRASLRAIARLVSGSDWADEYLIEWARLNYPNAVTIRSMAASRWKPSTANRHLSAVRGLVKASRLAGLIARDMADAVIEGLASVPAEWSGPNPYARLVTDDELTVMFEDLAGRNGPVHRRDAALLAILVVAGVRRSELVNLDLADLDIDSGGLLVRSGKGNKTRKVWLHGSGLQAVKDWLPARGYWDGPLLTTVQRGEGVDRDPETARMSAHAVWRRCELLARRNGIEAFHPHDLRGKLASDLLDEGGDINAVRHLLGHASIATTAIYDRRSEKAAKELSGRTSLPYVRPGRRIYDVLDELA